MHIHIIMGTPKKHRDIHEIPKKIVEIFDKIFREILR